MVADLQKRAEAGKKRLKLQEKIRVALCVQKAALQFIAAGNKAKHKLSKEAEEAGFGVESNELSNIVRSHDEITLKQHGGVEGIARQLCVSLKDGILSTDLTVRQNIYGQNRFVEKPPKGFWMFVWDACQDLTLIILMISAATSIGVGVATEGWPNGIYDGLGILLSIFLVVMVTAISDYKQSLQFRDLDKEKKNIAVPADGIFVSGYSLTVDESSLSGESEPMNVSKNRPFLLSGTKVQDGSGKMLVTAVGMRTEWGRLMETLSESCGNNETPLQVKLNGVATIIGKIGLVFAVLTFFVLTTRFLVEKAMHNQMGNWSSNDAMELLNFFAIAVIIIVVAVPEGLPLAVTLSLAFAMKKLMSDKALVRHLSACETMGSATCICTDKTGTLTTNHMVVNKIWMCENVKAITNDERAESEVKSFVSQRVVSYLLQSIFLNTTSEVVKGKDGKRNTIGTPTEAALVEFGLHLGGNSKTYSKDYEIVKVEPFNSSKKQMSVLVALPNGDGFRAFRKGASEIVLGVCDKVLKSNGEVVSLSEEQRSNISNVINGFACEALRTLCLGFKDVAKENSDVIIMDDNFTTIVNVVRWGRAVYINIQKFVQFQLTVNVVALMLNFISACISVNSRDMEKINVFKGMFESWPFMMVMVSTVVFQVIIVELLGTFAGTIPLSWEFWLLSILIGAVSLPVAVVFKFIPVKIKTKNHHHHDGYEALPSGPELV
ncbi:hypothetical protein F8388_016891 [Cannabis sativa]|uniref:Calcium-transporting ATPase n=1 Tax=Cannabis sativa TaxID=3483 RepID=A0A7J6ERP6_CANSA|nr:hypothetical protein F8388_016891 [Cannabis sativa]